MKCTDADLGNIERLVEQGVLSAAERNTVYEDAVGIIKHTSEFYARLKYKKDNSYVVQDSRKVNTAQGTFGIMNRITNETLTGPDSPIPQHASSHIQMIERFRTYVAQRAYEDANSGILPTGLTGRVAQIHAERYWQGIRKSNRQDLGCLRRVK